MNEVDGRWPLLGQCLCGAITLQVDALAGPLMFCHCRACRKSSGAPFIAVIPVSMCDFHLSDPQAVITSYRVTPHKARYFCKRCGCPIHSIRDGAEEVRVRAGLLQLPADVRLGAHIYCADMASWDEIFDDLPRYAGIEPGREALTKVSEKND